MTIKINITEKLTQLQQMASHLGVIPINNEVRIPASIGKGFCRLFELPFDIQLHHYQYCLDQQIEVQSINNLEDGMYILNINLSQKLLNKQIGGTPFWLSREGESGVLFYSPGNHSMGKNEIGLPFEVLFFSIPKSTLKQFLGSIKEHERPTKLPFCHYAEIEDSITRELLTVLSPRSEVNLFQLQGKILSILGRILSIFYGNEWYSRA